MRYRLDLWDRRLHERYQSKTLWCMEGLQTRVTGINPEKDGSKTGDREHKTGRMIATEIIEQGHLIEF